MNKTEKEEFIIGSIFLLANRINYFGDNLLPDITFKQWFLLIMISKMDIDEKNINSIAKFVGTTRQNIKKMLKPLETKGYVIISKSQQDARALKVELTQKTYQYFIDNDASTTYKANQLFEMFSDEEVNEFMNNLQKLQHCLEIYNERKDKNE